MAIRYLYQFIIFSFRLLTFLFPFILSAQFNVSGYVINLTSKEALMGVSVFYDGSTIGTITDETGYFELETKKLMTTNLVMSSIGFQTRIFDGSQLGYLNKVYLRPNAIQLDEAVLFPDTWTRKKKLRIFKKEFLGTTKSGSQCEILNEEVIRLYYNLKENKLFGYAEKPIHVSNSYLGYKIKYNLINFEVSFAISSNSTPMVKEVYSEGTLFFLDLTISDKTTRYLKRRDKVYFGSKAHFMRSLANNRLRKEKYRIFESGVEIDSISPFTIKPNHDLTLVTCNTERLTVLFNNIHQSPFHYINEFYIDGYGNYAPARNIIFGGEMGKQRTGNLLPLDYNSVINFATD